ncbi:MAG: hypothetical protein NC218_11310 [Acetobacter sp.]|nr:hypothetical protein [Acetobacter sp.]
MKPHIKDIMLLGGTYYVGSVILAFISNFIGDIFGFVWFYTFVISLIKLVWTKQLKSITEIKNKFPKFSFFLISIGWLPYIVTIINTTLEAINMLYPDYQTLFILQNIYIISEYIWVIGLFISIIYASYQIFIKKSQYQE